MIHEESDDDDDESDDVWSKEQAKSLPPDIDIELR